MACIHWTNKRRTRRTSVRWCNVPEASIMVGEGGRECPQCFKWRGPTVQWARPIFNTSEIDYGMCKTSLGCLCCSSSVFHVVFIVDACAGRDAGTQQWQRLMSVMMSGVAVVALFCVSVFLWSCVTKIARRAYGLSHVSVVMWNESAVI